MMSERLSDTELEGLLYHGCSSGTATPPMVRDAIVKAATELRSRRARDLTGPEVEEIEWLVRRIKEGEAGMNPHANYTAVLLAALGKVLGDGGERG